MKFILRSATLASVLALGVAGAHAADLAYEPVPVVVAPVFNWTGFYIGVHGGIGGGNLDSSFRSPVFTDEAGTFQYGSDWSDNAFGAFGGAQVGYNYQSGPNWVIGAEADIAASGISAKHDANFIDIEDGVTFDDGSFRSEAKVDWFGTIRGRIGYSWDNLLLYGTGGAAYGNVKVSAQDSEGFNFFSKSDTQWGWTAGAGFEYGITPNITLKTEYLYVDLGNVDVNNIDFAPDGFGSATFDAKFHTVKAGLNYKF